MNSSILTQVNTLMFDTTDMDDKFEMIEQINEALKKFVDDKNLQIAQLMNKLKVFILGESSYVLTCLLDFNPQISMLKCHLLSLNIKKKQSASVVALSIQ